MSVSLKDFASPMSKIEKTLEDTNKTTKSILTVVTGVSERLAALELITTQLDTVINQLSALSKKKDNNRYSEKLTSFFSSKKNTSVKDGIEILRLLGISVNEFSKGLIMFSFVPKRSSERLKTDITNVIEALTDVDTKNLEKNVDTLGEVGKSIFKFLGYIALSGPVAIAASISVPFVCMTVNMFFKTLSGKVVEQNAKDALKNVIQLGLVGKNILLFMTTMALAGVVAIAAAVSIPVVLLTIWTFSKIMTIVGKSSMSMRKGALALDEAAVSLSLLGLSLFAFSLAITPYVKNPVNILIMSGVLTAIGLIFAGAGLLFTPIVLGGLALTAVAVPLVLLSTSLLIFAVALKMFDTDSTEKMSNIISGLGKSFASVGENAWDAIKGAIAVGAMGVSLLPLSVGLLLYSLATRSVKDPHLFAEATNDMIRKIGSAFSDIGKNSIFVLAGAVAMIPVGISLLLLSAGLKAFKSIGWNPDKETGDGAKLIDAFGAIRIAFLGTDSKNESGIGGFFKKIGGVFTGAVDAVRMTEAAIGFISAGNALILVSFGLKQMKKLEWTEKDTEALTTSLGAMEAAFAAVGEQSRVTSTTDIGGVFGKIFGKIQVDKNTVKEGIDSVKGAGKALRDISTGLIDFTKWYNANKKLIDAENPDSDFFKALKNTLTSIGSAFASIGGEGQVEKGWAIFKWNKSVVAEGIDSVKGAGDALKGISEGIVDFTKWYNANKKLIDTTDTESVLFVALKNTLTSIGSAFAAIGGEQQVEKGWAIFKWNKNAVKEGIDSVKGVQTAMQEVVDGTMVFINSGITDDQTASITNLLTSMGNGFGALANANLKKQGTQFVSFSENFKKGFDIIYKTKDAEKRMKQVNVVMLTLDRQVRMNTFNKAAEGIQKIANAVNSINVEKGKAFSDLFTAAASLKDNSKFYEDLKNAVEEIRDLLAENGITRNNEQVSSQQVQPQIQYNKQQNTPAAPVSQKIDLNGKTISARNITINVSDSASITGLM